MHKIIAVDFDGTLAHQGSDSEQIGSIILSMKDKILLAEADGHTVWIFSARACDKNGIDSIDTFLNENGLTNLPITNIKHPFFSEFWDDKAIRVKKNTGEFEAAGKIDKLLSMNVFKEQVGGIHYKDMVIEPGLYCELNNMSALEANVVKYISRHKSKNGVEDLNKIIDTVNMIKAIVYGVEIGD